MTEIKRTREEARELAEKKLVELGHQGSYAKILTMIDNVYLVKRREDDEEWSFPFTPPAPEFKKGTVGVDGANKICIYNHKHKSAHIVTDYLDDKGNNNHIAYTFTPIYQNDPILERAFEMACDDSLKQWEPETDIKAHFLSQAKKELDK